MININFLFIDLNIIYNKVYNIVKKLNNFFFLIENN